MSRGQRQQKNPTKKQALEIATDSKAEQLRWMAVADRIINELRAALGWDPEDSRFTGGWEGVLREVIVLRAIATELDPDGEAYNRIKRKLLTELRQVARGEENTYSEDDDERDGTPEEAG